MRKTLSLAIILWLATVFLAGCNEKEPAYNKDSWKEIIPEDCVGFFDGCNSCSKDEAWVATCTMMYCDEYQEPRCTDGDIELTIPEEINEQIEDEEIIEEETQVAESAPKMRVLDGQTEEETQSMVEAACANVWGEWTDWACILEDGSIINF